MSFLLLLNNFPDITAIGVTATGQIGTIAQAAGAIRGVAASGRAQIDTEDFELNFMTGVLDPRLTYSRASTATDGFYTDATGSSYNTYAVNVPRMLANGFLVEDTKTNFLINSNTPATQSPSLSARNYVLWVIGTGSVTVTAGTATVTTGLGGTASAGTPLLFTVTVGGTVVHTVTGSLTRFQCESSAVGGAAPLQPTSYIPTAGAAVTRSPDLCSMATGAWYNTTFSTLAVECLPPVAYASQGMAICQLDDGTINNRFTLLTQPGTTATRAIDFYTANTQDILLQTGAVTAGVVFKLAATFTSGAASSVLNGGTPATGAPANWSGASLNRLVIGQAVVGTSWQNSNYYLRRLRYWGRTLSLAELKQATTQDLSATPQIGGSPIAVNAVGIAANQAYLNLDLLNTLDSRVVFTRASIGTYFDATSTMQTAAIDTARFDYDPITGNPRGVWFEVSRTNSIRNSTMVGAGVGNPGTMPTFWNARTLISGLSSSVDAVGVEDGIPYIDLRFFGTPTTTATSVNVPMYNAFFPTVPGDVWTGSFYLRLVAGSLSNVDNLCYMIGINPFLGTPKTVATPTSAPLRTQRTVLTTSPVSASATSIWASFVFNVTTADVPIDLTIRLGAPQLELGGYVSSFIPTSGATVTRSGDQAYLLCNPSWLFNANAGTLAFDYDTAITTAVPGGLSDGTFSNTLYFSSNALSAIIATVGNNAASGSILAGGALNRRAGTYSSGQILLSGNGSAAGSAPTGTPPFPWTLRLTIGCSPWGLDNQISGHMQRVRYWPYAFSSADLVLLSTDILAIGDQVTKTLTGIAASGRAQIDTEDLELNFMTGVLDPRLTFSRDSIATDGFYTDAPGSSYNIFAVDQPRMSPNGFFVEDSRTNYLLNSDAPVTQTVSLAAVTGYLWVIGTGSATLTQGTATLTLGNGGVATAGVPLKFTTSAGGGTVVVTVAGSLTRFQLEARFGIAAVIQTSYIPTADVAVTRATDTATMATGGWYNSATSTLAYEGMAPFALASNIWGFVQLDDSTVNNRFTLYMQAGTTGTHAVNAYTANTTEVILTPTGTITVGVPFKLASSYSSGAASMVRDGGNAVTGAPANWQGATFNRLVVAAANMGISWTNSGGYVQRIRYWGRALSVAELKQATTQDLSATAQISRTPISVTGTGLVGNQPTLDLDLTSVLDSRITFTRASTATYFDVTGVMQTAGTDVPRFDYDPVTHALKGLLIEEARTNLTLRSGDFTNASWARPSLTLSAGVLGPNGATTGSGYISANGVIGYCTQNFTPVAATAYTMSAYAKAGSVSIFVLLMPNTWWADATYRIGNFNLTTGTVSSVTGSGATATITAVGNGWYRVTITATPDTAVSAGPQWRSGANGDGVTTQHYVWAAQIEAGTFASSYIPTTTVAATRVKDAATIPVGPWYNQGGAGTVAVEKAILGINPTGLFASVAALVGSNVDTDLIQIDGFPGSTTSPTEHGGSVLVAGAGVGGGANEVPFIPITYGVVTNSAFSWAVGSQTISAYNGTAYSTTPVLTAVPVVVSMMLFGRVHFQNPMSGYVRHVRYWPLALSFNDTALATANLPVGQAIANAQPIIIGVAGIGQLGTIVERPSSIITGVTGSGQIGIEIEQVSKAITGVVGTGQAGSLIDTKQTEVITGVFGAGLVGPAIQPDGVLVSLTGVFGTGQAGSLIDTRQGEVLSGVTGTGGVGAEVEQISISLSMPDVSVLAGGIPQGCSADGSIIFGSSAGHAVYWDSVVHDLGVLAGQTSSAAYGCSTDGSIIVGTSGSRAVYWDSSRIIHDLGTLPGGVNSSTNGCSADGSIIVGVSDTGTGNHAVYWDGNRIIHDLGMLPGGAFSFAFGCSADGLIIVGASDTGTGNHAVYWDSNRTIRDLGGVGAYACSADGSIIVGRNDTNAVYWDRYRAIHMLAGTSSATTSCSADGSIVVGYTTIAGSLTAAAWINEQLLVLPLLPRATNLSSMALGVSYGRVFGNAYNQAGTNVGTVWNNLPAVGTIGTIAQQNSKLVSGVAGTGQAGSLIDTRQAEAITGVSGVGLVSPAIQQNSVLVTLTRVTGTGQTGSVGEQITISAAKVVGNAQIGVLSSTRLQSQAVIGVSAIGCVSGQPILDFNFQSGVLDSRIIFTRAAGPATFFDNTGILQIAGTDVPRFDYDPVTLICKGLLLEESRQNIHRPSVSWLANATVAGGVEGVVQNSGIAPDGTNTASLFIPSSSNAAHQFFTLFAGAINTTYTYSVFIKAAGYTYGWLQLGNTAFGANAQNAAFDLTAGTILSQTAGASATITPAGNGWFRCSVTATTLGTGGNYVSNLRVYNTAGNANSMALFVGDMVSGVLAWGTQVEIGTFGTSYIPTTTVAVTRQSDVAKVLTATWFDASNGTLFIDSSWPVVPSYGPAINYITSLNVGSGVTNDVIGFWRWSGDLLNTAGRIYLHDGTLPTGFVGSSPDFANPNNIKLALTWNNGFYGGASNGSVYNWTGGGTIIGIDTLWISSVNNRIGQTLRRLQIWPALSSADLQTLTSGLLPAQPTQQSVSVIGVAGTGQVSGQLLDLDFLSGSLDPRINFTRTVGPATYVDATGTIQIAGTNVPRFDYDPVTLIPRGLLLEEARTNLITYTAYNTALWKINGTGTITANTGIAPDGTNSAASITADVTTGVHGFVATPATPRVGNTTYTQSVYAKADTATKFSLAFRNALDWPSGIIVAQFNLTAVTVLSVTGGGTATITPAGNGWYRCSVTGTTVAAPTANSNWILLLNAANSDTFSGTGQNMLFWGWQIEVGSFATTLIPTNGAIATRPADSASMPTGSWYNQTNGTLIAETLWDGAAPLTFPRAVQLDDGTNNNAVALLLNTNPNFIYTTGVVSGLTSWNISSASYVTGTIFSQGVAFGPNSVDYALNGVLGTHDSVATIPAITALRIGRDASTGTTFQSILVRHIRYWPVVLSSSDLQTLTSGLTIGQSQVSSQITGVAANGRVQMHTEDFELDFMTGVLDPRLTFSRASIATDGFYTDAPGSTYNTYAIDQPRMSANGFLVEDHRINYLLNSDSPATQTTGVLPGASRVYVLWVIGTGSAIVAAGTAIGSGFGTATAGVPLYVTIVTGGTVVVTVTGSLTRFQLESSTLNNVVSPTSYIPTTTTIATRPQDWTFLTTGSWYNPTVSSLAVEAMAPIALPSQAWYLVVLDDGTLNNRYVIFSQPGTTQIRSGDYYTANTTDVLLITGGGVTAGVPFKAASTFTSGAASLVLNGGNPVNGVPTQWAGASFNRLCIGGYAPPGGVGGFFSGYIRRVRYWGRTLSLVELKQVTTQDPSVTAENDRTIIGVAGIGQVAILAKPISEQTVGLVGVAGVGQLGVETESISITSIGASGVGQVGAITSPISEIISKVTAIGQVGVATTQTADSSILSGVSAVGQAGIATTQTADVATLSGASAIGQAGIATTRTDEVLTLSGASAIGQAGIATTRTDEVLTLSGASAIGQAGIATTQTADVATLSGVSATGQVGIATIQTADVSILSGVSATGQIGAITEQPAGVISSVIGTGLTPFSRPSTAYYFDASGTLTEAAPDALRFGYDPVTLNSIGPIIEGARTNFTRNPRGEGAIPGTPGTLPTNWSYLNTSGLNFSVVGSGTEDGIPYTDLRVFGTSTTNVVRLACDQFGGMSAAAGQQWVVSACLRLIAGDWTNVTVIQLGQFFYPGTTSFTDNYGSNVYNFPTSAPLRTQRYSASGITDDPTTIRSNGVFVGWTLIGVGAVIDFTVRIGLPQTELVTNTPVNFAPAFTSRWAPIQAPITLFQPSPDGFSTAILVTDTTFNGNHYISTAPAQSLANNVPNTFSFYVKDAGRRYVTIVVIDGLTVGNNINVQADLVNGTVGTPTLAGAATGSAAIVSIGGGWYRVSVTVTLSASVDTTILCRLFLANPAGSYVGNGTGVYFWRPQLQIGALTDYVDNDASSPMLPPIGSPAASERAADLFPQMASVIWQVTPLLATGTIGVVAEEISKASLGIVGIGQIGAEIDQISRTLIGIAGVGQLGSIVKQISKAITITGVTGTGLAGPTIQQNAVLVSLTGAIGTGLAGPAIQQNTVLVSLIASIAIGGLGSFGEGVSVPSVVGIGQTGSTTSSVVSLLSSTPTVSVLAGGFPQGCSADGSIIFGRNNANHAVYWDNTGVHDLGVLAGQTSSAAYGCSTDGSIIVGTSGSRAVYWDSSRIIHDLGVLSGGANSSTSGCSADGSIIVGVSNDAGSANHAVYWDSNRTIYDLGILPGGAYSLANGCSADGSIIVGISNTITGNHAVYWDSNRTIYDLAGGAVGAYGCSADGSIIVGRNNTNALYWDRYRAIHILAGTSSAANSCSADGSIIVGYTTIASNLTAVAWINEQLLVLPLLPRATNLSSMALSGSYGRVFGYAYNQAGTNVGTIWDLPAIGAVGAIVQQNSDLVSGVAGTGQLGAESEQINKAITGVVGSGQAGSLIDTRQGEVLSGISGTAQQGSLAVQRIQPITGVIGIGQAGSLIDTRQGEVLSGISGTAQQGSLVVQSIQPITDVIGIGQAGSLIDTRQGEVISGVTGTGGVGTYIKQISKPLIGLAGAAQIGIVVVQGADAITLIGVAGAGQIGSVIASVVSLLSSTPTVSVLAGGFPQGCSADGSIIFGRNNASHAAYWDNTGVHDLGVLAGHTSSATYGCSTDGSIIVGTSTSVGGNRAVYWDSTPTIYDLGVLPGGANSSTSGCSADGSIIVGVSDDSGSANHAVYWDSTRTIHDLGILPGGAYSLANGCSADGSIIVGISNTSTGNHAVYWDSNRTIYDLAGGAVGAYACSADGSIIVGRNASNALYWDRNRVIHNLTGTSSAANSCSADGSIIVGYTTIAGNLTAAAWINEQLVVLPLLPRATNLSSMALGGSYGRVFGYAYNQAGTNVGTIWDLPAIGAVGAIVQQNSELVSSVAGSGQAGSLIDTRQAEVITGVSGAGLVSPAIQPDGVLVSLTGVVGSGQISVEIEQISKAITGVVGSGQIDTETAQISKAITGVVGSGQIGAEIEQISIALPSISGTGSVGTIQITQALTTTISGVVGIGQFGAEIEQVLTTISGVVGSGQIGAETAQISKTLTNVTGTGQVGNTISNVVFPLSSTPTVNVLAGGFPQGCSADGLIIFGRNNANHAVYWDIVVHDLGVLPGQTSSATYGCSTDGSIIVGTSGSRAVYWDSSRIIHDLGVLPGGANSSTSGCSADGSIIVGVSDTGTGNHAVYWDSNRTIYDLGILPGGAYSLANGCSADGSIIVGISNTSSGNHAVYWDSNRTIYDLAGGAVGAYSCSDDGSIIVGRNDSNALYWDRNRVIHNLAGTSSAANFCSADGSIIIGYTTIASSLTAAVWINEQLLVLPLLPRVTNLSSMALGGSYGRVFGYAYNQAGTNVGTIWDLPAIGAVGAIVQQNSELVSGVAGSGVAGTIQIAQALTATISGAVGIGQIGAEIEQLLIASTGVVGTGQAGTSVAQISTLSLSVVGYGLAPSQPILDLDFQSGILDPRITFTRASGATYFDVTGTLQTAGTNVPRFDYDPSTHLLRGLLIEEARTNVLLQSGDFTQPAWSKAGCTLAAGIPGPNGATTGSGVISNAGIVGYLAAQNFQPTIGTAYTMSCFLKAGSLSSVILLMPAAWWVDAAVRSANFNLATGIVNVTNGAGASSTITPIGNGWYRCSVTATPDAAPAGSALQFARATANGDGTTIQHYAFGAQFEAGAFPTSYIATTVAATRAKDVAQISPLGTWFNANAGTLEFEFDTARTPSPAVVGGLSDGTFANSLYFNGNGFTITSFGGGTAGSGSITLGTAINKQVGSWASGLQAMSSNGAVTATHALDAGPYPWSVRLSIGCSPWNLDGQLAGHMCRVRYWPAALSSADLRTLSSGGLLIGASAQDAVLAVGVAGTGQVGTIIERPSSVINGVSGVGQIGAEIEQVSITLPSISGTSSAGTIQITQALTATVSGVVAIGQIGAEIAQVAVQPSSITASGVIGTIQITQALTATIIGITAVGQVGAITKTISETILGALGIGQIGAQIEQVAVQPSSVTGLGGIGTIQITKALTTTISGVVGSGQIGAEIEQVSVTLPSISGTGSAGTLQITQALTATIIGITAVGQVGAITKTISEIILGALGIGQIGAQIEQVAVQPSSIAGSGVVGTIQITKALTTAINGVSGVGQIGSEVEQVSITLPSISGIGSVGTIQITQALTATISGVVAIGQIGTETAQVAVQPSSITGSGVVGTIQITQAITTTITGITAVGQIGAITKIIGGTILGALGIGQIGDEIEQVAVQPSSVFASSVVGTIQITQALTATISGVVGSGQIGSEVEQVSITLPSTSVTGSAGTIQITQALTATISGVVGSGQIGAITKTIGRTILGALGTGQIASTAIGAVIVTASSTIGSGAVGTVLGAQVIAGVTSIGSALNVAIRIAASLTGISATGITSASIPVVTRLLQSAAASGQIGVTGKQIAEIPVGVSGAGQVGTPITTSANLIGCAAVGTLGAIVAQISIAPTGVLGNGIAGTPSFLGFQLQPLTGVVSLGVIGQAIKKIDIAINGEPAIGQVGAIIIQARQFATASGVASIGQVGLLLPVVLVDTIATYPYDNLDNLDSVLYDPVLGTSIAASFYNVEASYLIEVDLLLST